jgi:hypothetical protein
VMLSPGGAVTRYWMFHAGCALATATKTLNNVALQTMPIGLPFHGFEAQRKCLIYIARSDFLFASPCEPRSCLVRAVNGREPFAAHAEYRRCFGRCCRGF